MSSMTVLWFKNLEQLEESLKRELSFQRGVEDYIVEGAGSLSFLPQRVFNLRTHLHNNKPSQK